MVVHEPKGMDTRNLRANSLGGLDLYFDHVALGVITMKVLLRPRYGEYVHG